VSAVERPNRYSTAEVRQYITAVLRPHMEQSNSDARKLAVFGKWVVCWRSGETVESETKVGLAFIFAPHKASLTCDESSLFKAHLDLPDILEVFERIPL